MDRSTINSLNNNHSVISFVWSILRWDKKHPGISSVSLHSPAPPLQSQSPPRGCLLFQRDVLARKERMFGDQIAACAPGTLILLGCFRLHSAECPDELHRLAITVQPGPACFHHQITTGKTTTTTTKTQQHNKEALLAPAHVSELMRPKWND